jgi:aminoglycoside phosphotransferase (APT) family kinase protein
VAPADPDTDLDDADLNDADLSGTQLSENELMAALAELVASAPGGPTHARVEGLRRLSGGASRETWAFQTVDDSSDKAGDEGHTRRALILQRSRPGIATMTGPSMTVEDALLTAAEQAGVPVPPVVVDVATASPSLGDARVTEHIDGEALGPRIVRAERYGAARARLAGQCGRALAAIHSIDPTRVPGLEWRDPLTHLRDGLDLVGEARPAFELTLRWLEENRPPPRPPSVVHGDFRMGNLIVDDTGLRAVLDWELAHLGDPVEDLGWLCVRAWRFGGAGLVGGVGDLDDLLVAYRRAGGIEVDADAVRWWIVAGTLTWGLICAVQARRHLDGHVSSVELATVGRRVCESEYDLLQLLGVPPPGPPDEGRSGEDPSDGPGGGRSDHPDEDAGDGEAPLFHGRPNAAELVEAVRDHLTDVVTPELSGAAAFHTKVAANALAMVARELRLGSAMARASADRLRGIGVTDEAELAAALRHRNDLDAVPAEVAAVVRAIVVDRLRVANPRWLEPPDGP